MNWFTKKRLDNSPGEVKARYVQMHGGCEHVIKDNGLAHTAFFENDPWGREGYVACKACSERAASEEDSKTVVCVDCKTPHRKGDGVAWKWYDFYAAQGDQPLHVCNACTTLPKHIERLRRDSVDRFDELGY